MNLPGATIAAPLPATSPPVRFPWLFSPTVDLLTFLGSAVVALALLAVAWPFGWLESESPEWLWVTAVLMIDVAHVYATGFRVYFDPVELRRRPWVYTLTPLLGFLIGLSLYSESKMIFWRTLAYLAVFHFVRQQYGWVALYRSRAGERGRAGFWIDTLAIYLATVYPLIHWHAHLPRRFWWFLNFGVPVVMQSKVDGWLFMYALGFASLIPAGVLLYNHSFEVQRWKDSDFSPYATDDE